MAIEHHRCPDWLADDFKLRLDIALCSDGWRQGWKPAGNLNFDRASPRKHPPAAPGRNRAQHNENRQTNRAEETSPACQHSLCSLPARIITSAVLDFDREEK